MRGQLINLHHHLVLMLETILGNFNGNHLLAFFIHAPNIDSALDTLAQKRKTPSRFYFFDINQMKPTITTVIG